MRSRYPSPSNVMYSFGPGPWTPAVKAIVIANVVMYVVSRLVPAIALNLGLVPAQVIEQLRVWELFTYMFLHGGIFHILFNMLALWMFGVELERMWGTQYFGTFYAVCGVGAAITQIVASFLPVAFLQQFYYAQTIGASGAIFGVLLAYGLYFPNRPILMYFFFPVPAKYFVAIMGGISLLSSIDGGAGGIAHVAHLGGLLTGYLYLKRGRLHPIAELKYQYLRWRSHRLRRRFDVHTGGRADRIH